MKMARTRINQRIIQSPRPGLFSLLKPYSGIVTLLIIMALLGSAINMLIPKIIAAWN